MNFEGQAVQVFLVPRDSHSSHIEGVLELKFDLKGDSVNKFNSQTLKELREAVNQIKTFAESGQVKGLLISSGKECFIVGADITEFLSHFEKSEDELKFWLKQTNELFSEIEDFGFPTVCALNGFAFGGGFELALSASYRVMSSETKVGLPETKLGIYPGWGGTVRLSRVIGADNAIEWIASGDQWDAEAALKVRAVDAVVAPENVRRAALGLMNSAIQGKLDWKARREEKVKPLHLNAVESTMVFETAKAFIFSKAGPNYPAPVAAIEAMQKGATKTRDEALPIEAAGFARVAKTNVAHSLVSLFLNDQFVKKTSKKLSKEASPVETAAVLGAGIMGGGIAYQSAYKGVPIYMKDITPQAIQLGMSEATKLLDKAVSRKKMTPAKMGQVLSGIRPTFSYGDFNQVDFVVEAVVEKEAIKKSVLAEVEASVKEGTILSSNTSTISINRLAEGLKHPENFCGMHFFNPVPRMPLVEVIRGKKSSNRAIATTVAYALKMGKTPIVVNDCGGFFINRVLFPYFAGFTKLLNEGVDFLQIDRAMEKFGWPMGPAFLMDVVGIDTANHADAVMAGEYPDRMKPEGKTAIQVLFEAKRFGQKNGKGFYQYQPDKKGPPKKVVDPEVNALLKAQLAKGSEYPVSSAIQEGEIVERMMLPMIIECSRCLEDGIVETPAEIDLGLVYGLGFPPFRGGALRYAESIGVKELCLAAKKYAHLGKLYEPTAQMLKLSKSGQLFYQG
jgi:3-hydroxyacyl-CoA dehydrogenase/enoyl-CoA hydratase/3-hydroxybutyryl-CoA epimerase/enoyl-CoA isomerase